MKHLLGNVFETFTITPIGGRTVILDKEWPCEAEKGDTVEIETTSGAKFSSPVLDKITFDANIPNQPSRCLPSLLLDDGALGPRELILDAKVFLVSDKAQPSK